MSSGTYLKALAEFLLLLIDDTQPEVYFVSLVEVRLHLHDLGECLFGMLQRPIAIVQYTDAIPQTRLLQQS